MNGSKKNHGSISQYQIREKITQLISEEATEQFYQNWLANHVTKADIDSLKPWGFNSVRLPMHYKLSPSLLKKSRFQGSTPG